MSELDLANGGSGSGSGDDSPRPATRGGWEGGHALTQQGEHEPWEARPQAGSASCLHHVFSGGQGPMLVAALVSNAPNQLAAHSPLPPASPRSPQRLPRARPARAPLSPLWTKPRTSWTA